MIAWSCDPAAIAALTLLAPGGARRAFAAQGPPSPRCARRGAAEIKDIFIRAPQASPDGEPLQVLIALHGMGGKGTDFGNALASKLMPTAGSSWPQPSATAIGPIPPRSARRSRPGGLAV